jgi:hypothetical protein
MRCVLVRSDNPPRFTVQVVSGAQVLASVPIEARAEASPVARELRRLFDDPIP